LSCFDELLFFFEKSALRLLERMFIMDKNSALDILQEARTFAVSLYHMAFLYFDVTQAGQPHESELLPLIWIDARHRPELADLWRVHATEGSGNVVTRWVYDLFTPIPTFYLLCQFQAPVRITFSLAFPLANYADALETMARCHSIALLAQRPPASFLQQTVSPYTEYSLPELTSLLAQGFVVESSHPELRQMTDQWKRTTSSSLK
jgi:hypothetical protein